MNRIAALFWILAFSLMASACCHAQAGYLSKAGLDAAIFRGPEAQKYSFPYEGTQYAYSEEFLEGSVVYNGVEYSGLLLNLSAGMDELHLKIRESGVVMVLDSRLVGEYAIGGRRFVCLHGGDVAGGLPKGHYEVLFSGEGDMLLKKNIKRINVRKQDVKGIYREFESVCRYYVVKDGVPYQVQRRGDFEDIFDEKRKSIREFVKGNRDLYPGNGNKERFFTAIMENVYGNRN